MEKYDPVTEEKKILEFWEKEKIREKAVSKNKGKKPFYFLDGPPYTSGKIHLGTAWNKSIKDMVTRYKRMRGFDVWDRAGYDMHGLPTEGKVQAKLDMKTKEEILKYGLAKFIKDCREWAVTNLKQMNKDFKRLGVWLDFDNAYQTIDNDYIEGTWWLVKKAHEKNRLYEGQMTMTWCGSCQTALAKHELEYKNVVDKSLYVKFKVKGRKDEYLIIWTTTPWTIPYNLGVMVNPDLVYVKAKVGNETWVLAKELVKIIEEKAGKKYRIAEEFKGKELVGTEYIHPMEDVLKHHFDALRKKAKKLHVVVPSTEYVITDYGTGLVHMAPGCGGEDYEVGHREGLPPFNQVNEEGYYDNTMGPFSGLHVKKNNLVFVEDLEKRGAVAAMEDYPHDYAHCWRCKNPILYRTTSQWFFRVEDLIPKMRKLNKEKMYWVPDWAGNRQFDSWLENLRDNGITRQRFWGSPLPVWKCDSCSHYVVAESRKELKKLGASHIPDDLHKPWIDEVTLPCGKCRGTMHRNPDIMDVWIDAGVDSWASLGYPHDDKLFKKLFPADFITEGKDQIRGWFNLLFVASMLAMEDISFKACYMTGFVNDAMGRKMSKSLGNVISPDEITEKYGADTFRYYSIGATAPGLDLNYNFEDVELKRRNLSILWNLHNFVIDLAKTNGLNPEKLKSTVLKSAGDEERYILSKLNSAIALVTEKLDNYNLNEIPMITEELYMELSRTYIQLVREKANAGTDEEKEVVLYTVYSVMKSLLILMAPVTPMITEMMYLNMKKEFGLKKESIHLYDWPEADRKLIDKTLEKDMENIKGVIQAVLGARERAQVGTRWPLQEVIIETSDSDVKKAVEDLKGLIFYQANVKSVKLVKKFDKADITIKPNFKTLGPEFGKDSKEIIKYLSETDNSALVSQLKDGRLKAGKHVLEEKHLVLEKTLPKGYFTGEFPLGNVFLTADVPDELVSEGYFREVLRRIQSFRKDAGLKKTDDIELYLKLDKEIYSRILPFKKEIKERVGAKSLEISTEPAKKKYKHSSKDTIKGLNVEAGFDVV
ncbi:TPA: isoleucine--tRNA ligase [Candidatus Woesearchaeota archaeon]|nr:Isoleucine-tRNA ligase [archaeon GW2011_AR15]MBS3104422.1 isoleucine--tRNA ligase [Candidatus Woesearchaeota archaeon]HIH41265.1 isoleucine--tRNA ligase [Candidatus Woesearchaeota archaeon]